MKYKIILLTSSIITLIGCNKDYINKTLEDDYPYYSYKLEGKVSKGTKCRFIANITTSYKYTYFGMSKYNGSTPYFDIGYNETDKTVNVTNIYKNDIALTKEDIWYYSTDKVLVMTNLFNSGDKITIECTITENLSEGLWAYAGNSNI